MTLIVVLLGVGVALLNVYALLWLVPIALPLLLAVPITVMTSHVTLGERMRSLGVLLIPEESWSPAVLRRAWACHAGASLRLPAPTAGLLGGAPPPLSHDQLEAALLCSASASCQTFP